MHGMKGGSIDDFRMLQSEYLGRKMTTSGLVATGAMITVGGNMTGSGAWMSPAEKQRAIATRLETIYYLWYSPTRMHLIG